VGFISVRESAHLKATVIAMQSADREIQSAILKETRTTAPPIWTQELAHHSVSASVAQGRMLVDTARVRASANGVTLTAATQKRPVLSGGATPIKHGRAFEFGAKSAHARRGQLPRFRKRGYVVYPSLGDAAPRIISLWVQTVMRHAHDALEGKR
jgi:hypothetical protein